MLCSSRNQAVLDRGITGKFFDGRFVKYPNASIELHAFHAASFPQGGFGVPVLTFGAGSVQYLLSKVFGTRPMCAARASGGRTPALELPRLSSVFSPNAALGSVIGETHIRLPPATWAEPPGRVHFWVESSLGAGTGNWFFCFSCAAQGCV